MQSKGEIICITEQGDIIGRFPHTPQMGTTVIDKRKQNLGEVAWIFGPAERPFVEIKTGFEPQRRISILNEPIYQEEI